jgi:integrase
MTITNRFPIEPEERRSLSAVTIADVIARIRADEALTPRRRDDLCSALRTMARALNLDPSALPANPRVLRQKLSQLSPAAAGVSARRWKNLRSLVLAALKQAGIKTMPGRCCATLLAEWQVLRDELADLKLRHGLSRFIGYLSDLNIEPNRVTAAMFGAFRDALENDSLVRSPSTTYTTTCKLWNEAAGSVAGWPALKVEIPDFSRRYALPFSAFPPSFETDTIDYLASLSRPDPFDEVAATPASPVTIKQRRQQILELASALVLRGHAANQITNLAVLADPTNAKEILRFFLQRAGGKATARIHHLACLLKTIGRRWVKVTEARQDELRAICCRLAIGEHGMTPKNRTRLRPFDDEANIRALVALPERLVAQANRSGRGRRKGALQVQFALAIAILLVAAPRIANLTSLNIDQHIIRTRPGAKGIIHLVIPGEETKTGKPQEFCLPAWVARILDVYLTAYRVQLLHIPSPWLFPNPDGGRRNNECFGRQIAAVIKKHTGLQMNVHLFRHLAVKLCHQVDPGDIETPQRLLNHRTAHTTQKFYSEFNAQSAHARYDAVIDRLRESDSTKSKRIAPHSAGRRRDRR